MPNATMDPETQRRWSEIRDELDRLKTLDPGVYAEVVALLTRMDALQDDNDALRAELDKRRVVKG